MTSDDWETVSRAVSRDGMPGSRKALARLRARMEALESCLADLHDECDRMMGDSDGDGTSRAEKRMAAAADALHTDEGADE